MVGIIVTLSLGSNHPNFNWELIGAGAILVELLGFLILVAGNLIYNKVVNLPKFLADTKESNI